MLRLLLLELFVTAILGPLILSISMQAGRVTFGVYNLDFTANGDGEFKDDWYDKYGKGLCNQLIIFFFLNNILMTYIYYFWDTCR